MKLGILSIAVSWVFAFQCYAAKSYEQSGPEAITDLYGLESLLIDAQYRIIGISPPSEETYWDTPETVYPVDFKKFPKEFTNIAYAELDKHLLPMYRIAIYEDYLTRETVFVNMYGQEMARLPAENNYDPFLWAKTRFSLTTDSELNDRQRISCDPAHTALIVTLLPESFYGCYLKIKQEEQALLEPPSLEMSSMSMMSLPATVTNLQMAISSISNGTVEVEVGWLVTFTNTLEIFATSNLAARGWQLVYTNIATSGSTNFIWNDLAATNLFQRFYITGNADLDTDGDGLTDAKELLLSGTSPQLEDTDGDGMLDDYEYFNGLNPTNSADARVDSDGDHIPNLYEYKNGQTDPMDAGDVPNPTIVVSTNGHGDTYPSIYEALNALSPSVDYQMVLIEPGTHTGGDNRWIGLDEDNILLFGTNANTVIDCESDTVAFRIKGGSPILSGLVIKNGNYPWGGAINIDDNSERPYIVNCVFVNNYSSWDGGAVESDNPNALIENCTIVNNFADGEYGAISGDIIIRNCLVWNNSSNEESPQIDDTGLTVATYSCVQDSFPGVGNITGDPLFLPGSWHLTSTSSSCFDRGDIDASQALDVDGEWRIGRVDIGADQFVDTDGDGLIDWYELTRNPPLNPAFPDTDDDGLSDGQEIYIHGTEPTDPDCDDDGLDDGEEIALGTNPWKSDTDKDGLSDKDEVEIHLTSPLLADSDGDGLSDYDEVHVYPTDPLVHESMIDTDGDGVLNIHEWVLGTSPTNSSDPSQGAEVITVTYPFSGQLLN